MSSQGVVDGDVDTKPTSGIRDTSPAVNPDFWDANVVVLDYCSSDGWTGDRAGNPALPASDVGHWHFRGRAIVDAVLRDLAGDGIDAAAEIFVLGGSAGGFGTAMNLDDVAARFRSARVVGAMDAAFFVDYPSYDPARQAESTAAPTQRHLELLAGVAAWGGRGDASCEARPPAEGIEYCRSSAFVVSGHHVSTPIFVRQSLADGNQTANFVAANDQSAPTNAYRLRLWSELWRQLAAVTKTAVFGTPDARHGVLGHADWDTLAVDGVTLPEAIGQWYRDPCGNRSSRIATR